MKNHRGNIYGRDLLDLRCFNDTYTSNKRSKWYKCVIKDQNSYISANIPCPVEFYRKLIDIWYVKSRPKIKIDRDWNSKLWIEIPCDHGGSVCCSDTANYFRTKNVKIASLYFCCQWRQKLQVSVNQTHLTVTWSLRCTKQTWSLFRRIVALKKGPTTTSTMLLATTKTKLFCLWFYNALWKTSGFGTTEITEIVLYVMIAHVEPGLSNETAKLLLLVLYT